MTGRSAVVAVVAAAFAASALRVGAATLPVVQISNDTGDEVAVYKRNSATRFGRILFVDANNTVWFYPGSGAPVSVQPLPAPGETVADNVFMLGSGSSGTDVIGGWRRGAGYGNVSVNGGTVQNVNLNPEAVAIRDGCVFMVLQTASSGNHVFKIDPANGSKTQISSGTVMRGALRVHTSQCKAAWTWTPTDADPQEVHYWNGTTTTPLDTNLESNVHFVDGKIVYAKLVSGIRQVFVVDTSTSTTPVQISSETDATKFLSSPQTDGRHVAWYRSNADGSSAQLILNGGVAVPAGSLTKIDNVEYAFQLDRGQLLWKRSSGSFVYDDGTQTIDLDPSPATTIVNPWLTDGYIAFVGVSPAGGTDTEMFRITGTTPNDAQPSAPLLVTATPGTGSLTVTWDRVLGATSYNLYIAQEPGVTKDNYASLAGGMKIAGVTSPYTLSNLSSNSSYYVAITTVEGATEGPTSRVASAVIVGNLTWQPVGALSGTTFYSVAADAGDASYVYAGANGSVYRSIDGGVNWSSVLANGTTSAGRTAALAVSGSRVLANMMSQADIWRSPDHGASWARILEAGGFGELNGSIAVDPTNASIMYAADFILSSMTSNDSLVIKSTINETTWSHTPEGPDLGDEIHAYAIAIDPNTPATLYAGGSGTPNVAKTVDGAASWTGVPISGNTGGVYSLAVDPGNSSVVYATTRDAGVFKSADGGAHWTAKNAGLADVGVIGTGFNSIVIDSENSNWLHLGAGNGYWYSLDAGETWTEASSGLGSAFIYALAMTPARRIIAATDNGLFMLSVAPSPMVSSVLPNSGHTAGSRTVTISGSAFQSGATVTFGGVAATNVTFVSSSTITATTPAHAAGAVDVVVTNPDAQSGTLSGGFTYSSIPDVPAGVTATAQTTTSVLVSWSASAGATSYQVYRKAPGESFMQIASPVGVSFTDTVSADTSYLYRVRAVNASGSSADSASDVATTMLFSNDPLVAGIVVQATHLSEMRTAIGHVRQLAGVGPASFTDSASPGVMVKAIHVTQMRSQLDEALAALGVTVAAYTDSSLAGLVIKAVHFQEIRNRMK